MRVHLRTEWELISMELIVQTRILFLSLRPKLSVSIISVHQPFSHPTRWVIALPINGLTLPRRLIITVALSLFGCETPRNDRLLVEVPESVVLSGGGSERRKQAKLELKSRQQIPLTIDRVESSCPCVNVTPMPTRVEPYGVATLGVMFDPADEPDFHGSLSVRLTGYSGGRLAFVTRINIDVD